MARQGDRKSLVLSTRKSLANFKTKKWNVYQTLGKISKCEIASIKDMAKKAVLPILFVHKDTGKFGKGVTPIALEAKNLDLIKLYKLDVLIAG